MIVPQVVRYKYTACYKTLSFDYQPLAVSLSKLKLTLDKR